MIGIAGPLQAAEGDAQARQRRQRCTDYSLRELRPNYLRWKAQEYLMEHPNATWNDYSAHIIQTDVSFQVSLNFLNDEEQTKAELASLRKEMKNLQTELQEHRFKAIEGTSKPFDPNQKGRQNATQFCGFCRTNGHTPGWCRRKIRDEELKRIENERTAEKKVTFTQDYNKKRGRSHGSGQWNNTRNFTDRANHSYDEGYLNRGRPFERNQFPNRNGGSWQRSDNSNTQNGNWHRNRIFPRSPQVQGRNPSQYNSGFRPQPI